MRSLSRESRLAARIGACRGPQCSEREKRKESPKGLIRVKMDRARLQVTVGESVR